MLSPWAVMVRVIIQPMSLEATRHIGRFSEGIRHHLPGLPLAKAHKSAQVSSALITATPELASPMKTLPFFGGNRLQRTHALQVGALCIGHDGPLSVAQCT